MTGALLALEGIDGCGKSTQARRLAALLVRLGLPVGPAQAAGSVVREPGGTALGEGVRELLLHRDQRIDAWSEALLYAAARAQLAAEVLHPALQSGRVLVLDRYIDSSLAYQGYARGLGIDAVLAVNAAATRGLMPHLTLVLDVDVEHATRRLGERLDRIEAEGVSFQRRVAEGYAELSRREPQRVRLVDATGDVQTVTEAVAEVVLPWLRARGLLGPDTTAR